MRKHRPTIALFAIVILFGAIGRSAVHAQVVDDVHAQPMQNPFSNPLPQSPYTKGVSGPYCDWHGFPPHIGCEVIVQPGTVFDMDYFLQHYNGSAPAAVGILFFIMCSAFSGPIATACLLIGGLGALIIQDQIHWAAAFWHRGAPAPGICLKLSWWFIPAFPYVLYPWVAPYEGTRCDFCVARLSPYDCI